MSERLESKNFVFEGKTYRTVTVIENGKPEPKKTILRRVISKSEYDKILKDDGATELSKSDSGTTYLVNIGTVNGPIKSQGKDFVYTQYADNDFKKLISQTGKNSLTKNLNSGSIEIIKDTLNLSRKEVREFYPEYANTLGENVVEGIKFALNDEKVPLSFTTNRRRKTYENLFYPEDIASSKQDRIKFGMRFISGRRDIKFDLDASNPLFIGNRNTERIEGSVTLPIPGGISDQNRVNFDDDSLDMFRAASAGAVLNPGGAASAVGNLLSNFINAKPEELQEALTSDNAKNIISALRLGLAGQVSGSNLFSRLGGGILNPNLELLFKAPALRSFQFDFTMSARSQTEASQIKKIIRFFKQGMSVKKTSNNIFVISPNIFTINYKLGSSTNDHPSIGRIKNCALTDLQTTYGNGNTYMTYDDPGRTMTQYTISLDFKELDPITEDDYGVGSGPVAESDDFFVTPGLSGDQIGY